MRWCCLRSSREVREVVRRAFRSAVVDADAVEEQQGALLAPSDSHDAWEHFSSLLLALAEAYEGAVLVDLDDVVNGLNAPKIVFRRNKEAVAEKRAVYAKRAD